MKKKPMNLRQVRRLRTVVHRLNTLAQDVPDMLIRAHLTGIHAELNLLLSDIEKGEIPQGREPPTTAEPNES
jgi:hypothetical protein